MILSNIYHGFRNAFVFNKCVNYSANEEYEKAFQLSESLNFKYSGRNTYIHMVLYIGYAALVTNRLLYAQEHFDYFLKNIDSIQRFNDDEKKYLKSYAAKCYLTMDCPEYMDLELKNRLKEQANEGASNIANVAKRLKRTFPQF